MAWRQSIVCLSALLLASACATVAPYQRERLAERAMQLDPDPLWSDVEEHNHAYREGAAGGFGGGGGGCGCN